MFFVFFVVALIVHSAHATWTASLDLSTGSLTSLTDGVAELVSPQTSDNVPRLVVGGVGYNVSGGACAGLGPQSWTCDYTVAALGLRITYNVALTVMPDARTLLTQTIDIAGRNPAALLAVIVPRAATLLPLNGTRRVTGHYLSGSPFDYAVTSGDEPNGVCFVAAGAAWLGPHKITPAYPGYCLSVPAVEEYIPGGLHLTLLSDPWVMTTWNFGVHAWSNDWQYAFNCSDPDILCFADRPSETRTFYTVIDNAAPSVESRMSAVYATALASVPAPPAWVHSIRLTNYDYFSPLPPSPNGWDADVDALAASLPNIEDRQRVVFCLHGWYGLIGQYTLDDPSSAQPILLPSWTIFPDGASYKNAVTEQPVGPLQGTTDVIRARARKARDAGFRVVLYFADGLNTCTDVSFFSQQAILTTYHGYAWKGPDSLGQLHLMNPLHPNTTRQFKMYLSLLLETYGDLVNGFVWDETFELSYNSPGVAGQAEGYAARAWMELIRDLRQMVRSSPYCAECVFLVASCLKEMPMALVVDGTFEDTGLDVAAAPFGVLPNYQGVLWECGWADVSRGFNNGNATEGVFVKYNVPAGIANGWGDFIGFGNMTAVQKNWFVGLMAVHDDFIGPRFPQ